MKKPHKHAELIKAWADGAEIQHYLVNTGIWCDTKYPSWSEAYEYRIKPADPKPEYIPFTWEDRDYLRGKWIMKKEGNYMDTVMITSIFNSDSGNLYINGLKSESLLKYYTFLDGSPCGRLKK